MLLYNTSFAVKLPSPVSLAPRRDLLTPGPPAPPLLGVAVLPARAAHVALAEGATVDAVLGAGEREGEGDAASATDRVVAGSGDPATAEPAVEPVIEPASAAEDADREQH